jgi:hypothetical protein
MKKAFAALALMLGITLGGFTGAHAAMSPETAAHCISRLQTEIKAEFYNPKAKPTHTFVTFRSVTVGFMEKPKGKAHWEDWALLHSKDEHENIPEMELDCAYTPKLGEPVAYYGFPGTKNTRGLTPLFATGYVSGLFFNTENKLGGHFTFDAPGAGGSSGSAVVSMKTGKIIGILTRVEIGDRDIIGLIAESIKVTDMCEDVKDMRDVYGLENVKGDNRITPEPTPF